jgi:hypothetical protein
MRKSIQLKILFLLFFPNISFAQNLNCADFREGVFILNNENMYKQYFYFADTGETEINELPADPHTKQYVIERNILQQREWHNEIGYGSPSLQEINWTGPCTYNLKYLADEEEIDEISQIINETGGLEIEILEITGNCMHYKSSIKFENGNEIYDFGQICKQIN